MRQGPGDHTTIISRAMSKVLIADDDPTILMLLRVNLEMEGHEVVSAANGSEAIETAREEVPDLVILDVMMPGMDGWEACKQMREFPALSNVPIIFLSARAQETDIQRGQAYGAEYVTKPFDPPALMETVARVLTGEKGGKAH